LDVLDIRDNLLMTVTMFCFVPEESGDEQFVKISPWRSFSPSSLTELFLN
jgi:hypothetical protein